MQLSHQWPCLSDFVTKSCLVSGVCCGLRTCVYALCVEQVPCSCYRSSFVSLSWGGRPCLVWSKGTSYCVLVHFPKVSPRGGPKRPPKMGPPRGTHCACPQGVPFLDRVLDPCFGPGTDTNIRPRCATPTTPTVPAVQMQHCTEFVIHVCAGVAITKSHKKMRPAYQIRMNTK